MRYRIFILSLVVLTLWAPLSFNSWAKECTCPSSIAKTTQPAEKFDLKPFAKEDYEEVRAAWATLDRGYSERSYKADLAAQKRGDRSILVARKDGELIGFVTVEWKPTYPPFARDHIPEIADLYVLPKFQRRGIGRQLVLACEELARKKGLKAIGIGVGVAPEYGPAQRLYVSLGYQPDGRGLQNNEKPVHIGETVTVNHRLGTYLTKPL